MADRKFFHGTMNASKSAQLLMQAYNFERQGKTFVIFKPSLDTRDGDYVQSRALDEKRHAFSIKKDETNVIELLVGIFRPDFIFLDEIQFFMVKQIEEFARISIKYNIPIFAYGLLISYNGKLFESSKRAIECGFTLHEIKMQCDFCKNKSTHHILYNNDKVVKYGDGIQVGDTEYKSVCYECFYKYMQ